MCAILLIDDDTFFRDQISAALDDEGYDVKAVGSGGDTIEAVLAGKYDAFIVDIYMDEINGTKLIPIIKKVHPYTPVIVVTGDDSLELERKVRTYGVFYYLIKPFAMEEIKEVMGSAVKKR